MEINGPNLLPHAKTAQTPSSLCVATWGKQNQGTEATKATCSLETCCVCGTESYPRALAPDDQRTALGRSLPGNTGYWAWGGGWGGDYRMNEC